MSRRREAREGAVRFERAVNLYGFIRLRLGPSSSDREIARRWGMEWKSFCSFKHGRRPVPRVDELEALAAVLECDPEFVFQAARGVPAAEVMALLGRQGRLRVLLDRATDAVFTLNHDGLVEDMNARFCELVDRARGALEGVSLLTLVTPESMPRAISAVAAVSQGLELRGVELALRRGEGDQRVVEMDATIIRDAEARVMGAQVVARDVTGQRRLVREIDVQRRTLQAIFDHVPAACILVERDGTISAANRLVENVCLFTSGDLVGRRAAEVFGDSGPTASPIVRAFETGATEQRVSWLINRARQQVFVHRTAGPISRDGRVDQVIELMVDVTDQVQRGDLRILPLWRSQTRDAPAASMAERRISSRVGTHFMATCRARGKTGQVVVENMSSGGLQFRGPQALASGEEVQLDWVLPEDGTAISIQSRVVWAEPLDSGGGQRVGVRFLSVTPELPTLAPLAVAK